MSKLLESLAKDLEQKILVALENGTAPWIKPWSNQGLLPHNPYSGTIYQGINALRLMCDGYLDNRYLTFYQIKELGGYVKSGEKAGYVLYVGTNKLAQDKLQENDTNTYQGMLFKDDEGSLYQKVFKKYAVFNMAQCEGIDLQKLSLHQKANGISFDIQQRGKFVENPFIEQIISNSQIPIIHHNKDKACYISSEDTIYLPPKTSFKNKEQYYSTALHEIGHATGHKQRLNRDLQNSFGSENYAKEELRAELYSFLQALDLSIDYDLKHHASYVQSWLKVVKNDTSEISKAIKDSIKMVRFVKERWYPKEQTKQQEIAPIKEQHTIKTRHMPHKTQDRSISR